MIKDIGIEGLNKNIPEHSKRVTTGVMAMIKTKDIAKSIGSLFDRSVPPAVPRPDMVDVTTMDDTERVYMECFPESTGPR